MSKYLSFNQAFKSIRYLLTVRFYITKCISYIENVDLIASKVTFIHLDQLFAFMAFYWQEI